MRKGVDKRAMAALSVGHLFTDVNQGAVAALIPFLVAERGLSLAAAGTLVLAATLSSSIVQPLFGFFSDRTPLPALMPLGVMVGGAGIALVGVAPNYLLILICTVLSGLGVAAFHPESARFASYVSGARRARGMSFFSVGGNAGFALGPVISTPLVLVFGLPGTLFLALPALLMGLVLFYEVPRLLSFRPEAEEAAGEEGAEEPEHWGPFVRMVGAVAARSFVFLGRVTCGRVLYPCVRDINGARQYGPQRNALCRGSRDPPFGPSCRPRGASRCARGLDARSLALDLRLRFLRALDGYDLAGPRWCRHDRYLRGHGGDGAGVPARQDRNRRRRYSRLLYRPRGRGRTPVRCHS